MVCKMPRHSRCRPHKPCSTVLKAPLPCPGLREKPHGTLVTYKPPSQISPEALFSKQTRAIAGLHMKGQVQVHSCTRPFVLAVLLKATCECREGLRVSNKTQKQMLGRLNAMSSAALAVAQLFRELGPDYECNRNSRATWHSR